MFYSWRPIKNKCYPLCFCSWRQKTTVLPLMFYSWRPIKNKCYPLCFFSWRPIKTTVLPLIFYLTRTTVLPLMFFFMTTDKKTQCFPLLFFFMTTNKKQQCYPLCFFQHGLTGIREMTTVGRLTRNPWTHHGNTPISVMWPRNSLQCKLMTLMFRGSHTDPRFNERVDHGGLTQNPGWSHWNT